MSNYNNETYTIIWRFTGSDLQEYCVVRELDTFKIFQSIDIEEIAYTNNATRKDHKKLNGIIHSLVYNYYVIAKDNFIHCEWGTAICCPCGIDTFIPNTDIKDYLIYGQVISEHTWLSWVKDTANWPKAMAHFLGAKDEG